MSGIGVWSVPWVLVWVLGCARVVLAELVLETVDGFSFGQLFEHFKCINRFIDE